MADPASFEQFSRTAQKEERQQKEADQMLAAIGRQVEQEEQRVKRQQQKKYKKLADEMLKEEEKKKKAELKDELLEWYEQFPNILGRAPRITESTSIDRLQALIKQADKQVARHNNLDFLQRGAGLLVSAVGRVFPTLNGPRVSFDNVYEKFEPRLVPLYRHMAMKYGDSIEMPVEMQCVFVLGDMMYHIHRCNTDDAYYRAHSRRVEVTEDMENRYADFTKQ